MKNMIRLALLGSLLASASTFADVPKAANYESQVVLSLYEVKDDGAEELVASFATLVDGAKPTRSSLGHEVYYTQSCAKSVNKENEEITEIEPGVKNLGVKTEYMPSVVEGVKKVDFDFSYSVLDSLDVFHSEDVGCAIQLPRVSLMKISGTLSESGYEKDFAFNGKKMKVKFEVEKI